jgi:hypothetical protein
MKYKQTYADKQRESQKRKKQEEVQPDRKEKVESPVIPESGKSPVNLDHQPDQNDRNAA